jgi:hypothetical protein
VDEIKVDTFLVTPFQSTEEEEDFSSEENEEELNKKNEEIKSSVHEPAFELTINVDPFLLPRENEEKISDKDDDDEETSTEEKTKTHIDPSAENYDISTSLIDLSTESIITERIIGNERKEEEVTTEKVKCW